MLTTKLLLAISTFGSWLGMVYVAYAWTQAAEVSELAKEVVHATGAQQPALLLLVVIVLIGAAQLWVTFRLFFKYLERVDERNRESWSRIIFDNERVHAEKRDQILDALNRSNTAMTDTAKAVEKLVLLQSKGH